jgi:hypothetical protein
MTRLKQISMALILTCWITSPDQLFAEKTFAVVGRSAGQLAVLEPDQPWRVVPAGGLLPEMAECRSSADGPGQIVLGPDDALFLSPLSVVKYDMAARRIHLHAGRLFCAAPAGKAWAVTIGVASIEIAAASVETVLNSEHEFQVTTLRGTARILIPNAEPTTQAEKTARIWIDLKPAGEAIPLAQEEQARLASWTTPLPPGQGPGQLLISDPQNGSQKRLSIARFHAELELSPPMALVKLDQAFYNPSHRQQEGEFVFNLPPGAAVCRFAMYVTPTQLIEGEIIDRARAEDVYSSIVRSQKDPAILEKIGDNLFRMRVFPIPAHDIKRILLHYTLPLEGRSGQFHMQLPMLSDLEPIWDFRIHGSIHGPTPLATVNSPTHPQIAFQSREAGRIDFHFTQRNYLSSSDVMLTFQQPLPDQPATFRTLIAPPLQLVPPSGVALKDHFIVTGADGNFQYGLDPWNDQSAAYFLAEIPTQPAVAAPGPADMLVLLETSTAVESINRLRPVLQTLLAGLRPQDRVRLICVDAGQRPLHDGWLKPGSDGVANAWKQFETQFCLGGNDLLAACQAAGTEFAALPADNPGVEKSRRKLVVYIGDGLDTAERKSVQQPAVELVRKPDTVEQSLSKANQLVELCHQELHKEGVEFWAAEILFNPSIVHPTSRKGGGGQGFFQIDPSRQARDLTPVPLSGRAILNLLAQKTRGRCFDLAGNPAHARQFFEWVLAGIPSTSQIRDLKVNAVQANAMSDAADIYAPANFLPGETIRVTGRMVPSERIKLTYRVEDSAAAGEAFKQADKFNDPLNCWYLL